ncbi:hypothetical protein B0H13DRAFT_1925392, partial [Mycena leptocephala]
VLANGHGLDVQNVKRNQKGCDQVAKLSAKLVQDIWTQTRDFDVALPAEVEKSVVEIGRIKRFAHQNHHKGQIEEYDRLLQEAMLDFSVQYAAIDEKRHTSVLAVSQMTEAERLQLLTQICDHQRNDSAAHSLDGMSSITRVEGFHFAI